jgi:hypothetical protein
MGKSKKQEKPKVQGFQWPREKKSPKIQEFRQFFDTVFGDGSLKFRDPGPILIFGEGLKNSRKCVKMYAKMDFGTTDSNQEKRRPACFGDEVKYVAFMERATADAECAKCLSGDECGEFILLKCSRELIF